MNHTPRTTIGCRLLGTDDEPVTLVPGDSEGIAGHEEGRPAELVRSGQTVVEQEAAPAVAATTRVDGDEVEVPMGCGRSMAIDPLQSRTSRSGSPPRPARTGLTTASIDAP